MSRPSSPGSKRRRKPGDPSPSGSLDEIDVLIANLDRTMEDLNDFDDVEGDAPTTDQNSSTGDPALDEILAHLSELSGRTTEAADEGITKQDVVSRFTVEEASGVEPPQIGVNYQVMPDMDTSSLDSTMRGGEVPPLAEPGKPAPVVFQLLMARLVGQMRDAGLTPGQLTERAVAAFTATFPRRTLDTLSAEEKQDPVVHIDDAVHEYAKMSRDSTVRMFKSIVRSKAMRSYGEPLGRELTLEEQALFSRRLDERFDPHVSQVEWDFYRNADGVPQDIRDLAAGLDSGSTRDPLFIIAERFLADHLDFPQEPNPAQKTALTKALEALPVVTRMYQGTLAEGEGLASRGLPKIVASQESQKQQHFKNYENAFRQNVREGMMIFESLVSERRRPPQQHTATIEIAADKVVPSRFLLGSRVTQHRAQSARVGNKILLSVMDNVPTVVHEIGHQVEYYLPLTEWMRLQSILRMRMVGPQLIDIYPEDERKEAALHVTGMPAFQHFFGQFEREHVGKYYPAKVYPSGDTELMSMTMEFFSRPETAEIMINHDPLLAGTVLRAIRPDDFDDFPAEMAALLPS